MTDRELMQMALDALERYEDGQQVYFDEEIEALRARLAQPEPGPVAWMYQHEDTGLTMCVIVQQVGAGFEKNNPRWKKITPLYTAQPQREWQGLTDEEIMDACSAVWASHPIEVGRVVEEKLKEKNG